MSTKAISIKAKPMRIGLSKPETQAFNTVSLNDKLECRLNPVALEQSIEQNKKSKLKTLIGWLLLGIGMAVLMISALYAFSIYSKITDNPTSTKLAWFFKSMVTLGLVVLAPLAGAVLLKTEKSRLIRPLTEMKNGGFETPDMQVSFREFCAWASAYRPKIGFVLTKRRILYLPDNIWSHPSLAVVLFGKEPQRRTACTDHGYALSRLEIRESDWNAYMSDQSIVEEPVAHRPDPTPKPPEQQEEMKTKPTRYLSLRQRKEGEFTSWSPRFEMIRADSKYIQSYMALKVDINSLRLDRQPCHRLLVFMEANFKDFDLFFKKGRLSPSERDELNKLDEKVKRKLGVQGQQNIGRFNDLKTKSWIVLEKYIEDTEIISDDELVRHYPSLRPFMDSQLK